LETLCRHGRHAGLVLAFCERGTARSRAASLGPRGMTVSGRTTADQLGADRGIEQLRLVIDAVPTGMLMIDRTGSIGLVNARLGMMFGYACGELIGRAMEVLVPERLLTQHPGHRARFAGETEARRVADGRW